MLPRFARRRRRQPARAARPQLEVLEDRCLLSVVLGTNFQGMNYADSGGWTPPDTDAAVGPTHVVETVNETLAIFDKVSGAKVFQQSLAAFFAPVGPGTNLFDPTVAYDEDAGRFIVAADEMDPATHTAWLDVAVSDTSDPTAGFTEMQRIEVDETNAGGQALWGDQPKFGRNADAYVFSFNMFAFDGSFDHVQTLAIDKSTVLDMDPTTLTYYTNDWAPNRYSAVPATMHGSASGGPLWFMDNADDQPYGIVRVSRMDNVLSTSPTITDYLLSVSAYGPPPTATQPGTPNQIQTSDDRIQSVAWSGDRLVAAHEVGTGGVAHARWYDINTAGGTPTLTQQGDIDQGAGVYTYFPSIEIAPNGDLGMTFMESSSSEFMSAYVTGRKFTDPAGTMETPVVLKAGEATYHPFDSSPYRAGDYSGISVDPLTNSFWAANEYATSAAGTNWGTWIGSFTILPLTTPSAQASSGAGAATAGPRGRGVEFVGSLSAAAQRADPWPSADLPLQAPDLTSALAVALRPSENRVGDPTPGSLFAHLRRKEPRLADALGDET